MNKYAQHVAQPVPQSEPVPGKPMVKNPAGGYVFEIDDFARLRRFLILGCEGGTYYEGERKLALENADVVRRCVAADGKRALDLIVDVSDRGLAVKNDPAIFALAVVTRYAGAEVRKAALDALPKVCRIGTHLFQFAEAREAVGGGWGRGLRGAVSKWYDRPDLTLQALKYQQRGGWSHRDLLRLAHPDLPERAKVLDAICRPSKWSELDDPVAASYVRLQASKTAQEAAAIVAETKAPREFVPTEHLKSPEVWAALLPNMPMTALVRNLGNLSKCGLLVPLSDASKIVVAKLSDADALRKSRLHPFSILVGAKTYAGGHGLRGSGTWTAVPKVIEALDSAYDKAFANVEPTGKRHVLGIDVSGSMGMSQGEMPMTSAEAAAAMAMITVRTEPEVYAMGFATQFVDLGITAKDSLLDVLRKTRERNFGGTDTSVAIAWALKAGVKADAFVIYTDNETWAGDRHTSEAIKEYRRKTGLPTKLAVVAFSGTNRSVADGADPGSMDFVGLDASLPQALAAFVGE
jgi:60 kDa SS-A/Ro ribonucleoprotein